MRKYINKIEEINWYGILYIFKLDLLFNLIYGIGFYI